MQKSVIDECITIHFFEDNPVFDCESIFLSSLILKIIGDRSVILASALTHFLNKGFISAILYFNRKVSSFINTFMLAR